ncbi:MAG: fatty acid desaturase, partial [Deltaproteobacteria bacterium]|nr:fatty acid desaturase [Deltaproteobacteria bacterium]
SHKAFQCHPALKIFYLILGASALQQSALVWASDHRFHHRYVDTEKDPYNIKKGFWWAHVGWLLAESPESRKTLLSNVPDLAKDKWVMWQHKYWVWISIPLSFGIPLLIGFWIDRPIGMLLWGILLRIAITHHTTFTINSIAHSFGTQPYSDENSAKDVWWLAPFLCGEHYHNYHHCFQGDYRNGIRWYHWDPSKWFLWMLSKIGLVKNLQRTPDHLILKARLEMDLKQVEKMKPIQKLEYWAPLHERLLKMRQSLVETAEQYAQALKHYREMKKNASGRSQIAFVETQKKLEAYKRNFDELLKQWRENMRVCFETYSSAG